MTSPNATTTPAIPSELRLPLGLLSSYLFFLLRRPISASNTHYLQRRLAGLQSLIPLFATSATPQSQRILCGLQRLRPAAFAPTARQLELDLFLAGQQVEIPQDFVVSSLPPNPPPFRSVRSIVIVTGPAIGIGDEIILFPLPAWIKAAHPNLEVTVVSGYRGLWDRVNGVDHLCHYSTHKELLEILRGPAHAVLLADFEKPGLAPLIASEPGSGAYIELSLGAQHCIVVDRQSRRIWTSSLPLEAGINYYEAFARLVEWLGVPSGRPARYAGVVRHDVRRTNEPLRILASPFTSKYDPSLMYWSNLLANLFPEGGSAAVEFVIDPGASLATARFAEALQRSATARSASNVKYAIAGDSRTLGLADFLGELERAHAVVCADSFAAHASPQFGCTTIVIAKPGLENWRTPSSQSFYFDVERPVKELLAGMRAVLAAAFHEPSFPFAGEAADLDIRTRQFTAALEEGASVATLNTLRAKFLSSHAAVMQTLPGWPPELQGVVRESLAGCAWRRLDDPKRNLRDREILRHLRSEMRRWETTNLRKFAGLAARSALRAEDTTGRAGA